MKNNKKHTSGITLIALVVTIIVLLILAGISIAMLSGNNGILQRAGDAKQTSERAEAKEQAQMDIMDWITDKTANNQNSTLDNAKVKEILIGKSYVKNGQPGNDSFITAKGEYEIPYSELYKSNDDSPSIGQKLTEIITSEDYGKPTDYSVTVNGKTLNNWKVFLNDENNVYIIMGEYLEASLVQDITGIETDTTNYKYGVWHNGNRTPFLNALLSSNNWSFLTGGITGATATGAPTIEQLETSYGQQSLEYGSVSGDLYVLPQSDNGNCDAYWIASPEHDDDFDLWAVSSNGELYFGGATERGLRPLIKLSPDSTGKKENGIIKIDK
ncbi:MAG TPA: hypothetical protein DEP51_05900 [Clostridiales bacterium]|nr:hypothetical protein [Clostridiales bacterium]